MSSTDSSDEENLQLLAEAVDGQLINDSMFQNLGKTNCSVKKSNKSSLISLRTARTDQSDKHDLLGVTPQFQQHVAKKLSELLDKNISYDEDIEKDMKHKKKKVKNSVKLLSNSSVPLSGKVPIENTVPLCRKPILKPKELIDVDFKQIAVKPEDILSKKEVQHWSNWSKSKVYRYKKSKNKKLEFIEPDFELKQKKFV